MKIYLNREPINQPWGGGNRFITALHDILVGLGHNVTFALQKSDVYICFDPRPNNNGITGLDIINASKGFGGKVFCRVGDVGTHGKNFLVAEWIKVLIHADCIVFPSNWARDYLVGRANPPSISNSLLWYTNFDFNESIFDKMHVITNGAAEKFFLNRRNTHRPEKKINVVCHHWSNSPFKGFSTYEILDDCNHINFTYIGRKPENVQFKNCIEPMSLEELVIELPKHDVYFTASQLEAGANHVLEGLAAGLPIVYSVDGGSINEYVDKCGVSFEQGNEITAIDKCVASYDIFQKNALQFKRSVIDAVNEFVMLL